MSEKKANLIAGMDSISSLNSGLTNKIYPVGSIYMSVNSTSPAELFGGTWEQIKDTFLLACGDTYSAGIKGGEAQHTLTVNEMPGHGHLPYVDGVVNPNYRIFAGNDDNWYHDEDGVSNVLIKSDSTIVHKGITVKTNSVGGSQPHNNMPPYLAVYVWKRTA